MTTNGLDDAAARRERVRLCERHLRRAAAAHFKPVGVAMYLWGSVMSDDFCPDSSDVDVLLISASCPESGVIERLKTSAACSHPLLGRLDISVVALSELASGRRVRLRNRIDAELLFGGAGAWLFVWGAPGLLPAGARRPCSLRRQLQLRRKTLIRRLAIHSRDPLAEPGEYILKELGFICHLVHQLQVGEHPFSYAALEAHATSTTREAVDALIIARRSGWKQGLPPDVVALAQRLSKVLDSPP